jgi:hypothetical protein
MSSIDDIPAPLDLLIPDIDPAAMDPIPPIACDAIIQTASAPPPPARNGRYWAYGERAAFSDTMLWNGMKLEIDPIGDESVGERNPDTATSGTIAPIRVEITRTMTPALIHNGEEGYYKKIPSIVAVHL